MIAKNYRTPLLLVLLLCSACSRMSGSSSVQAAADRPRYEASLGTAWGERIKSRMSYVSFHRDDPTMPHALAAIYYDRRDGIEELIGQQRTKARPFQLYNGVIEAGLISPDYWLNRFLPGAVARGRYHVVGEPGDRYGIYLKNNSSSRIEAVLSVDGLDVINGRKADYKNRGYIVDPGETLEVWGFRDSRSSVAAFRFAEIDQSYARLKHGDASNAGVIGVAVFAERGSGGFFASAPEGSTANPFPGEFASAP